MRLEPVQVILKPLITEKSTWEAESRNRYAFEIHRRANKTMVKDAVAKLYKVRVRRVAVQHRHGKYRRTRWGTFRTRSWKKAIVELHPDDRIDLF